MNKIQQIKEVVRKECPWSVKTQTINDFSQEYVDVQLSDILYCMRKEGCPIGIDINGRFIDCDDDCTKYWVIEGVQYDLTKPFKDQSEEVIDFLHNIICKK